MHKRYVESQKRWADIVFSHCPDRADVRRLAGDLRKLATKVQL
jgi:hypothetical protein